MLKTPAGVWRQALIVSILACVSASLSFHRTLGAENGIAARWEWHGTSGWQRLKLDLHEQQGRTTGTITMGPGGGQYQATEDFWEYFFNPITFEITNVSLRGEAISFEQEVFTHVESNAVLVPPWFQPMKFRYTGRLEGDRLILTRELHQSFPFPLESRNQSFEIVLNRAGALTPPNLQEARDHISPKLPSAGVVDFIIQDDEGKLVTKLTKDNLQIHENGSVRQIKSFIPPDAPWNVLFLLDVDAWLLSPGSRSGDSDLASTVSGPKMKSKDLEDRLLLAGKNQASGIWLELGESITGFYKSLRSQDRLAIDIFDVRTVPLLSWKNGGLSGKLTAAGTVQPNSPPAAAPGKELYGAIYDTVRKLQNAKGRKVAIVFTDGRDGRLKSSEFFNNQHVPVIDPFDGLLNDAEQREFDQLAEAVRKSGIRFYFALVNAERKVAGHSEFESYAPGANLAIENRIHLAKERMKQLAEVSGGSVLYDGSSTGALVLGEGLAAMLRVGSSYSVEYESANGNLLSSNGADVRISGANYHIEQARGGVFHK